MNASRTFEKPASLGIFPMRMAACIGAFLAACIAAAVLALCSFTPVPAYAAELGTIGDWYNDPVVSQGYIAPFTYRASGSISYSIRDSRIKFQTKKSYWDRSVFPAFVYTKSLSQGSTVTMNNALDITIKKAGITTDGTRFDIFMRCSFVLSRPETSMKGNESVNLLEWIATKSGTNTMVLTTTVNNAQTNDIIVETHVYFECRKANSSQRLSIPVNYFFDDIESNGMYGKTGRLPETVTIDPSYGQLYVDENCLMTISNDNTTFAGNNNTSIYQPEKSRVMLASNDGRAEIDYTGSRCYLVLGVNSFGYPRNDESCISKSIDSSVSILGQPLTYTVDHNIQYNLGDANTGYQSVIFSDTFNNALDPTEANVRIARTYNDSNNTIQTEDVTDQFAQSIDGQTISLCANSPNSIMGTYQVVTTIPFKPAYDEADLRESESKLYLDNTATVTINGDVFSSNTVSTQLVYPSASISATDTEGTALEGAVLSIRNDQGEILDSWTSGTAAHMFDLSGPQTYTVVESQAPGGYRICSPLSFSALDADADGIIRIRLEHRMAGAKLSILQTADPPEGESVHLGNRITYTATIQNSAEAEVSGSISARCSLPDSCIYLENSCSEGGVYDAASRCMMWGNILLAPGQTKAISYSVRVFEDDAETIQNAFTVQETINGVAKPSIASNAVEHCFVRAIPTAARIDGTGFRIAAGSLSALLASVAFASHIKRKRSRKLPRYYPLSKMHP